MDLPKVEKKEGQLWLSYSKMSTYKDCGLHYKYKYIDKIDTGIKGNYHTALGNGIHKCLEEMYKLKNIEERTERFLEAMWNTVCYKGFTEKNNEQVLPIMEDDQYQFDSDDQKKMFFNHGKKLLRQYYHLNKHEFERETVATELNFQIPVGKDGNVVLNGFIDRIDRDKNGKLMVIDYKTGSERTQEDVDNDLQLTLYAFAIRKLLNEKEGSLMLYFIKNNNAVVTRRTKEHFDKLLETVKYVKEGIQNEIFEPKESNQCRYCYFDCPLGLSNLNKQQGD